MRTIETTGQFERDYKRELKTNRHLGRVFQPLLQLLAADAELPDRLADHKLSGEWKGCRDCHVKPDLVLIYEKPKGVLKLMRIGSHSEVFS